MLTLPTVHPHHPHTDLTFCAGPPEPHIRSFWPSVTPAHGIPGKAMLTNNFQELPHFPESFFPRSMSYPCQREIISEGIVMACYDNQKNQFPFIQNQNVFINGPILKAVQYTSRSFQPQEGNIVINNNRNPAIMDPVFQTHKSLESFGSLVSRNKDNVSLSLKKVSYNKCTKMKEVLEKQISVRPYGHNDLSNSFLDINLNTENQTLKEIQPDNEEDKNIKSKNLPPGRKKLGHSIASILNISPRRNDCCMVSEVRLENSESDSSYCVDNFSDDDSMTTSDILVDDDDTVGSSRSDDDDKDDQVMFSEGCNINYKQCLLSIAEDSSKNEHSGTNNEPVTDDIIKLSATSSSCRMSSSQNVTDDTKTDFLGKCGFLKVRQNRDCVCADDVQIFQPEVFTFQPAEGKEQHAGIINGASGDNNTRNNTNDNLYSSQINPKIIPDLRTEILLPNAQSTSGTSKVFVSSASFSSVLPPIQTLCQPYQKVETRERSAFKPIRKLSSTSQQLPPFLTQYRGWTEKNTLTPNIHPLNRTTHVNPAATQTCCSAAHLLRQNRNDLTTNKSKLKGVGILRQKSSYYQSQRIPDIFLPASASVATELLPNTLESWMTWLRQREADPTKSNTFEHRTTSRVPVPPRYHCEACRKTYSTFGGLSKHRQFHCTQHVKKEFVCKVCNRAYSSLGALKMHIRTHTLPCRCQECGKAFSRPWLLQGHLRTHTGEKPFKCNHCGRAFADRSNLRAHLQTHAEIKRYACIKCGKTFSRMSLLTKHIEGSCPVNIKNN